MTRNARTLIYAANLHVGGGVQVAVSFVDEISRSLGGAGSYIVIVSGAVHRNLTQIGCQTQLFDKYLVEDHFGHSFFRGRIERRFPDVDVIFVVFGPFYQWFCSVPVVVGFAQPWIINPKNELYDAMPIISAFRLRVKFFVQKLFFLRAALLVVELPHVRAALRRQWLFKNRAIEVVGNCISRVYLLPQLWSDCEVNVCPDSFNIGFVGRNYPHKNVAILPAIKEVLRNRYRKHISFYVTFTDEEWLGVDDIFRRSVVNVGALSVSQCPSFYNKMDAVIFPSLLECFSATPIEAMVMKKILFASDRDFNRDVCGDNAHYFDPLSIDSAAEVISNAIDDRLGCQSKVDAGYLRVMNMTTADVRAQDYISCIDLVRAGN